MRIYDPNGERTLHGGASPSGEQSPNFKHGKHSKYRDSLTMKLREYFDRHLNDSHLLNLRSEIAVAVALVHEGLEAMQRGESGETWRACQAAYRDLFIAVQVGNETARVTAVRKLGDAIDGGMKEYRARREVTEQMERIRRLVRYGDKATGIGARNGDLGAARDIYPRRTQKR